MSNNYDIIVIGAGCGGLTAAVCAAKEGKKVLLLERHNTPGGFATGFVRGRFEFDVSLQHLFGFSKDSDAGELKTVFDSIGISDKVDWAQIPDAFRFICKSESASPIDVTMPFGVDNFIKAMGEYDPDGVKPLEKLFALAEDVENAMSFLAEGDGKYSVTEIRRIIKEHGNFVRTASYSVNEVFNALAIPQKTQDILKVFWLKFGVDCNRLSFVDYITAVYPYIKYGSSVPTFGSHALSMALVGALEDNDGEIRYNAHVSRILFEGGHATGVILKNGERIMCNHIICTCSPTFAYSKMMKKSDVPISAIKRTNARSYGGRGACVYLGLNRSPEELGIKDYSVFITDSTNTAHQFSLMKSINTNNVLTAVCSNIANPKRSPAGTTILCLSTFYTDNCWADISPENYFDEKDMLAARLIANYEQATGIVIHNNIEELEVATPITFAEYTNTPQGTVFGYFRDDWDSTLPRIITEATDSDTKGLRFCGGWGTQHSGIATSVVSGRNTAFATLGDIAEERSVADEK